jgi:hypothetical protein
MNALNASKMIFAAAVAIGMTAGALASVEHVAAPKAKAPIVLERVVIVGHRVQPTMIVLEKTIVVGRAADVRMAKNDGSSAHRAA